MPLDPYQQLVHDLAALLGLADHADAIHASGSIVFREVAVTLAPGEEDSGLVHVYIDYGDFPEHKAQEIFRRLLEINLLVASQGSPRLGLDPESGRVIFCWSRPMAGLSARQLLGSIDMAVSQALAWRGNFYLDEAPARIEDLRHALHV